MVDSLVSDVDLKTAKHLLMEGKLIGMPTETVYGLAADASNPYAVASIYEKKGRPSFNPLIIHVPTLKEAEALVEFNATATALAEHFWPGPLTLVLPRKASCNIAPLASAGLPTLAIRIPYHPVAQQLLQALDRPIAAPSANLSNQLSPTTKTMVQKDFPDLFILDGGPSVIGLESTIIGFEQNSDKQKNNPILLRPGSITAEDIEKAINVHLQSPSLNHIQAPGMTKKHYAPKKPLRMNAINAHTHEAFLGFGKPSPHQKEILNLSLSGNLTEAASNLFQMLHFLEQYDCQGIAVAPIPNIGIGIAINDRLCRGSQKT